MSKFYCTPSQMREIEKTAVAKGSSYLELMENAGASASDFILKYRKDNKISGKVSVICGKGNNGGDGYVIARNLHNAGVGVSVLMMSDSAGTDISAKELGRLFELGVSVFMLSDSKEKILDEIYGSALIIDAVFGTGFHGELPDDIGEILHFADKCLSPKIAIDIPSGGNGLTGTVSKNTIRCNVTLSFALEKIGTAVYPLSEYTGEVVVCDIKIPKSVIFGTEKLIRRTDSSFVRENIPIRRKNSHKGDFGKALNIAGSENMPGAAALSTKAALRSGAGLVTLASVKGVVSSLSQTIHEAVYLGLSAGENGEISADNIPALLERMNNSSVAAVGCGLSVSENTKKLVKELVKNADIPLIIDADGLNCLAPCIDIIRNAKGGAAVTPHPAELSRLLDIPLSDVLSDRLGAALRFNSLYDTVILAKGSPTFIIGSDAAYASFTGNAGLSRGGSGDVLTGVCLGLVAMGIPLDKALASAAWIHGRAADIAADRLSVTGMLPSDVIDALPFVFKEMNR